MADPLVIAGRTIRSRLFLGTGKFPSAQALSDALEASACEIVTVALKRVDLERPEEPILSRINRERHLLLPNTAGAATAEEAVRIARMARAAGLGSWLKLEIHPDPKHLLPDPIETLKAAELLVKEGFTVLPYMGADPVLAKRLEEAGAAAVMPLGSYIGSCRGLQTRDAVRAIVEAACVPVVVDAGLGVPSHAAEAMELGVDAVLVNTAIAVAEDPAAMARAFRLGVEAGRMAFLAGRAGESASARATSPVERLAPPSARTKAAGA